MYFKIEQTTSLELAFESDKEEIIEISPGVLAESGSHKKVSEPKFKEDRERWLVVFQGHTEPGTVKVHVTYSVGVDGQDVEDVEVVAVPKGLTVHSVPNFVTQDCSEEG